MLMYSKLVFFLTKIFYLLCFWIKKEVKKWRVNMISVFPGRQKVLDKRVDCPVVLR
jgi:hypothetical protein